MPGVYLFSQLSFAIQKIIQFHSDLRGGSKIEKVDQGAPLSPTGAVIKSIWSYYTNPAIMLEKLNFSQQQLCQI